MNTNTNWYDDNAEQYAELSEHFLDEDQIDAFVELLPDGARVLDAGCGGGRDSNIMRHKDCDVVGINISQGLLSVAREKYPEIEFLQGNLLDLPFENEVFDGVWAHASLVHFESENDFQKAVSELCRVLKKGGAIHILVKAEVCEMRVEEIEGRVFGYRTVKGINSVAKNFTLDEIKIVQYKETDTCAQGRKGVEWIYFLGRKI